MNPIAEEILMHYGMPRRSGRYPWGSGENPYQHSGDFLSRIDELKSQGMSDTEIAKAMGLTTTQYRTQKSLAKDERRALDVARAKSLREDGLSLNEIAKEMGFVIVRDNGCDLGIEGHEIYGKILIHHMNPISVEDILKRSDFLLNPEYLISTILTTHNAIHYGDESLLITEPIVRSRNDTCPWKR